MRIGIVGNYGNNNNGDEAILVGAINQVMSHYEIEKQDIVVFSNNPEQTKERYGVRSEHLYIKKGSAAKTFFATFSKHIKTVKKLDLLIIGGGGILMDLYGREAILFGMYGWLGKLTKTPVVIYGVGVGPIKTQKGAMFIRSLASIAKMVSVRDPQSKELLEKIGVTKKIHEIGDPAFKIQEGPFKKKHETPLKIGVTAVPYYHKSYWPEENEEKYSAYITGMAKNLDQILSAYPNAEITFFATKFPQDMWVTKDVVSKMHNQKQCHVIEESLDPMELVAFSENQDLVIGTRLHSLILSIVSETPVMAISYHHKVRDFMTMIGRKEDVINIEELHNEPEFFLKRFNLFTESWKEQQEAFKTIASTMKTKASKGMNLIKEHVK